MTVQSETILSLGRAMEYLENFPDRYLLDSDNDKIRLRPEPDGGLALEYFDIDLDRWMDCYFFSTPFSIPVEKPVKEPLTLAAGFKLPSIGQYKQITINWPKDWQFDSNEQDYSSILRQRAGWCASEAAQVFLALVTPGAEVFGETEVEA